MSCWIHQVFPKPSPPFARLSFDKGISFGWMICSLGPLRHVKKMKEIVLASPTSLANIFLSLFQLEENSTYIFTGHKFLHHPTLSWLKPAFPRNQGRTPRCCLVSPLAMRWLCARAPLRHRVVGGNWPRFIVGSAARPHRMQHFWSDGVVEVKEGVEFVKRSHGFFRW